MTNMTNPSRAEITSLWKKVGLLNTTSEPFRETLACVLENQRRFNEQVFENHLYHMPSFKRVSIPLLVRFFSAVKDKVDIQANLTYKFGRYTEIDASLKWDIYDEERREEWERCHVMLDYEAGYTSEFANRLAESFITFCEINEYTMFNFNAVGVNKENTYVLYGKFGRKE